MLQLLKKALQLYCMMLLLSSTFTSSYRSSNSLCHSSSMKARYYQKLQMSALDVSSLASTLGSAASVASVVAIHEAGHYLAGRWQGIKVESFNIGYGPKLLAWNESKTGTEFALRMLPLGGYVAFPSNEQYSEDGTELEPLTDPDLFANRPVLQRIKVIVAGIVANLMLSLALSTVVASTTGINLPVFEHGVVVQSVSSNVPAAVAGIQPKDIIVAVNDELIRDSSTSVNEFVSVIKKNEGKLLTLSVKRNVESNGNGIIKTVVIPQRNEKGVVSIGVGIAPNLKQIDFRKSDNIAEVRKTVTK